MIFDRLRPDEPDQYAKLCRAMESGLLLTINNSESAQGRPSDELRVISGGDETVLLVNQRAEPYQLFQDSNGDTILARGIDDKRGRETYVSHCCWLV